MQHTYTVNIEHDVYRYFLTTKEYHQGTLNTPCSAERILTSCLCPIIGGIYLDSHGWSVDVLYSAAYTFIDIWLAIPATKLLATSSYKLGFYRYGWGSRTFRNITIYSLYSGMTQHDTATSKTFLKVTLHSLFFTKTDEQFTMEITRNHISYCSLLNVSKVI